MAERAVHTSKKPRATAAKRERDKSARYDCTVRPLFFEAYGRLGPASITALAESAREACLFGRAGENAFRLTKKWRQYMELALAYAQADALLAARGAMPNVAGPTHFPVGRMVRRSTAAQGEHSQQHMP